MKERDANKRQALAILASIFIHGALLLIFLFLVSWKAPNPPLSSLGGIELNFGLDDSGSGDIQPETPSSESTSPSTEQKDENQVQENTNPVVEDKNTEASTLTSPDESSVQIPETKEPKKTETKKTEPKEVDSPKNNTSQNTEPSQKTESVKKGKENSQGDDKVKGGDKGSPEGSLDANALYGKQGTGGGNAGGKGGGFALQMAGWGWDEQPKAPKLPDNENGRVVFEIEVDETGEITSIKTIERSLSPEAEKICKQEILRRSLIPTSQGTLPERSKGRVAFVLKTQ